MADDEGAARAASELRAFADHAEREFEGEDQTTDYARGALDGARIARVFADRLEPEAGA